jgi:hypothetical protein
MKVTFSIFAFTALTISISLAACGGGGKSAPTAALPGSAPATTTTTTVATVSLKEQITKLEDSGALPKLDRSTSIPGPDVNNNGVRDDIEAYIAALQLTEVQKKALMQDAKAMQMTLTVDLTDKVALQRVGDIGMASTNCIGNVITNFSDYSQKIESMTANTKERAKQYMKYNAARSGSVTSLPSGDTCEK